MEARYKGNLASEEHRGDGSDAGSANAVLEGTSLASFDELSKARFKVNFGKRLELIVHTKSSFEVRNIHCSIAHIEAVVSASP